MDDHVFVHSNFYGFFASQNWINRIVCEAWDLKYFCVHPKDHFPGGTML